MRVKAPDSGRTKGTPNKRTQALEDEIRNSGFEPITAMCRIGKKAESRGDLGLAIQCAKELANYLHPKKRTVLVADHNDDPISFNIRTSIPLPDSLRILEDCVDGAGSPQKAAKQDVTQ
jgi:hypothetical protein